MASPFARLEMSGLSDDLRGLTQAPFPVAPRPGTPAQGASAQPQRNPFGGLFTPDAPGVFGVIGRLSGAPSREEAMQQQQLGARGRGLGAFTQMVQQNGGDARRALLEFVNTAEGQEMLMTDPNGLKQLLAQASALEQPAAPDPLVTKPGDVIRSADGREVLATNPQAETAKFTEMADLAGLPPEEMQELARAQLEGQQTGDKTAEERAISRLISAGAIDRTMGDKLIAGTMKISGPTAMGEFMVTDLTTGKSDILRPGGMPAGAGNAAPGDPEYAPGLSPNPAPEPEIDPDTGEPASEVPADIIFGAGLLPMAEEWLGGIIGQQVPGWAGRDAALKRGYLRRIRADLQNYRSLLGEDRSFARDAQLVDDLGNFLGGATNPAQTFDAMLQLHDFLDRHMEDAIVTRADQTRTATVRANADSRISGLQRIRASLPTREALGAIEPALAEYNALTKGLEEGTAGVGMLADEARGLSQPAPGESVRFDNVADYMAAHQAGEIVPGTVIQTPGGSFIYNPDAVAVDAEGEEEAPEEEAPVSGGAPDRRNVGVSSRQRMARRQAQSLRGNRQGVSSVPEAGTPPPPPVVRGQAAQFLREPPGESEAMLPRPAAPAPRRRPQQPASRGRVSASTPPARGRR